MKTALINLFTAFVLIAIDLTIMYYHYSEANGDWDDIISSIAMIETFALICMWKPKKHERTAKNEANS